jgi:hypothetical protein
LLAFDPADGGVPPDADEIAATAWRTLQLPDVTALRTRLVPEWPIYRLIADQPTPRALAGRIDAIAYEGDRVDVVIDGKSDIDRAEAEMRACQPSSRTIFAPPELHAERWST